MLNCRDVTHLLSEGQDRRLSLTERVMLQAHLVVCKGCANFSKQMSFLRAASRRYGAGLGSDDEPRP